ncbi:MAG: glutamate 5-kinase [Coriobacteriia bacterium]|nr:glutamate 5-kinase [Coriobacteriia bacterium]
MDSTVTGPGAGPAAASAAASAGAAGAGEKKLVVKIGSSTLVGADGRIDHAYLDALAAQVAEVRAAGWQVVVVSSGAIACGLEALGMTQRPTDMPSLQAAASVGQSAFASAYAAAFGARGILTSSVLLTRRDTADRTAYLHARDTMNRLLELGVVPIVNENDTVSVEQIRFGDNDTLAALVACLVEATLVVILSDIDGLYDANPVNNPQAKLIPLVNHIGPHIMSVAGGTGSSVGSGGMVTKLRAARVLMAAGIPLVVACGRKPGVVRSAAFGEQVGTRFASEGKPHEITPRKLWIALGDSAKGAVIVDEGARNALINRGSSLLPVGIAAVDGRFSEGDIVDVKDAAGYIVARGRVAFDSDEVSLACGMSSEDLAANRLLSRLAEKPVMHRDELIVFE